jgi:acyl-CoA synthetase (AMP-forming)/AMP-acid ligase II
MPELEILRVHQSRSATPDEGLVCLVCLVDRMKDMISRGGENAYCVEVEDTLAGARGSTRRQCSACQTR